MKKSVAVLLGSLWLIPLTSIRTWAVWPPETSLQEPSEPPARDPHPGTGRIEEDVQRLEAVLQDLKQDCQQDLKPSQQKPAKEDPDGHPLH